MLMPHTASASSVLCKTSGTAAVSWASRACDMRLVCVGGRCWQHTRARRLDERDAWRATRRPTMHIARNSSARKGRAPIPCENVVRSHVVRRAIMKFPENLAPQRDRQNAQPTPPLRCHHGVSCGQGRLLSKLRAKCTFRAPLPRIALHSTLTLSLGHYLLPTYIDFYTSPDCTRTATPNALVPRFTSERLTLSPPEYAHARGGFTPPRRGWEILPEVGHPRGRHRDLPW